MVVVGDDDDSETGSTVIGIVVIEVTADDCFNRCEHLTCCRLPKIIIK